MKVFSPSQTATHRECPIRRALRNEGWVPRRAGRYTLDKIRGTAFAVGMAHHNSGGSVDEAASSAEGAVNYELDQLRQLGVEIPEWQQGEAATLVTRVTKGVRAYAAANVLPASWRVVAVEQSYGEERCRPDLVVDDGAGLMVVDYKCKLNLRARDAKDKEWKLAQLRADYSPWGNDGHQLLHYCWRVNTTRYAVVVVVLEPKFEVHVFQYEVGPEEAHLWITSVQEEWQEMEALDAGERTLYHRSKHWFYMQECEYSKACRDYHMDENLMVDDYIKKEPK